MIIVQVIVAGLAGWRLASLLVNEEGPGRIFEKLRAKVGATHGDWIASGFWAELLSCVWCSSVWSSAAMFALWYVHPAIPGVVAAMSIAVVTEGLVRK